MVFSNCKTIQTQTVTDSVVVFSEFPVMGGALNKRRELQEGFHFSFAQHSKKYF